VIIQLLFASCLMALSVATHALGVTVATRRVAFEGAASLQIWTWRFILLAWWMVLMHLIEITLWAMFYLWQHALTEVPLALYFSAVTYTTTGYGDVVLPMQWRLVGAVEALTGILMCGWSTGFFFTAVARMVQTESR
jgi:hypothetical protein